jgi:transmembrane sensor
MLRREAASWLSRLQSGRDPYIEAKFRKWRGAHPRHAEAFERVRRSYEQAGLLRDSPMLTRGEREPQAAARQWAPRPALAAAVAILILAPVGVLIYRSSDAPFGGTDAVMLTTRVGEIRQVRLADGSRVTLDTSTRVDVEIGGARRSAHLRYGRVRFEVVQASAPFTVETAGGTITTQRGTIDVEEGALQDRVQVLAGAADVRGPPRAEGTPVALGAGESLTITSGGAEQKGVVRPAADWTRGMLQFDETPLAEAVALANRYSTRHIILADDLDALRVSGAFRAGDTTGLAKALAAAFGLSIEQRADGALLLARGASAAVQKKNGG